MFKAEENYNKYQQNPPKQLVSQTTSFNLVYISRFTVMLKIISLDFITFTNNSKEDMVYHPSNETTLEEKCYILKYQSFEFIIPFWILYLYNYSHLQTFFKRFSMILLLVHDKCCNKENAMNILKKASHPLGELRVHCFVTPMSVTSS